MTSDQLGEAAEDGVVFLVEQLAGKSMGIGQTSGENLYKSPAAGFGRAVQIKERLSHDPDDFLEGRCAGSCFGAGFVELGQTERIKGAHSSQDHFTIEGFLVAEMIVHRGEIGLGCLGRVPERDAMKSMSGKKFFCRVENACTGGLRFGLFCSNKTNV